MTENVLIAGCGDLGHRVARRLLSAGHAVWGLRRRPPDDGSGLQWIAADLSQPATLAGLPGNITQLVLTMTPDAREPSAYRQAFLQAPRNLLQAMDTTCLRRMVFVSSSAVYGEHQGAWVDELTPAEPLSFNGEILLEAERALAELPLQTVVLRLAGLYGPGRLQLIRRLQTGSARAPRALPHWSNRIHIDDAAAAVTHLLELAEPDSLYLGVDSTPLPLHVLYDYLAQTLSAPAVPEGSAPAGVGSKRLSNRRLLQSGLQLKWPDSRAGYAELLRGEVS